MAAQSWHSLEGVGAAHNGADHRRVVVVRAAELRVPNPRAHRVLTRLARARHRAGISAGAACRGAGAGGAGVAAAGDGYGVGVAAPLQRHEAHTLQECRRQSFQSSSKVVQTLTECKGAMDVQEEIGLASAYELEGVGPRVLGVAGHDMHALEATVRPDGDDEPTADTELLLERLRYMILHAKNPPGAGITSASDKILCKHYW